MIRVRATVALFMFAVVLAACSSSSHKAGSVTATTSSVPASTNAPTKPTSSDRAASLVREAEANARRQGWVHIDTTFSRSGKTIDFSQDSGPARGRQTVTIGAEHATVVLIDGVAYVNADAGALHDYLGLASTSASFAGKWMSIRPSDDQYVAVVAGVTLADALKQDTIVAPFAIKAPTVVDGQHVIAITGTAQTTGGAPPSATLYVPVSGTVLPVEFDITATDAIARSVFSHWGTAATLTAPPNPVAFASIVSAGV
jgi:hypothetical protein